MRKTDALRAALVEQLRQGGLLRQPALAAAFAAVPRHLFVPHVPPERAYADAVVITKTAADDGRAISSSSQPAIMAIMLDQLDLRPGQRVLEVGAGTGYNAALIAHIVGPVGQVTAIDIDQDLCDAARSHLDEAGYPQVRIVCGDGTDGYHDGAPYDRIIVTAGASDVPAAWWAQLNPAGGRIVVPLTLYAGDVSVALERDASVGDSDVLVARSMVPCGFMRLRGPHGTPQNAADPGGGPEAPWALMAADVARFDCASLAAAFRDAGAGRDVPLGARAKLSELNMGLSPWLGAHDPRYLEIHPRSGGGTSGVPWLRGRGGDGVEHIIPTFGLGAGGTVSLIAQQAPAGPHEVGAPWDLCVRTFGPHDGFADRVIALANAWDAAGRPGRDRLRLRVERRSFRPAVLKTDETALERPSSRIVMWYE